jgi:hypothetical protein
MSIFPFFQGFFTFPVMATKDLLRVSLQVDLVLQATRTASSFSGSRIAT